MTPLILELLKTISKEEPTLKFGELLYTLMRPKYLKNSKMEDIKWLREVKDNDFYTAAEKAINEIKKNNEG